MSTLLDQLADEYREALQSWDDPYGTPVIEGHALTDEAGLLVHVVRDDLLLYGSKIRFLDYLVGHFDRTQRVDEWVFGSCPATGYAQISLGYVCRRYGKRAVMFMAKRKDLHPYQIRGEALGVDYRWCDFGRLTVTQAAARRYAEASPDTRKVLPIGLEHPLVSLAIEKVARDLTPLIVPTDVWSVGSSGSLNRGLQAAWPHATVHVVSVGHGMNERERGRATLHRTRYRFDEPVERHDAPPFPSAPTYDAKAWHVMRAWYIEHPPRPDTSILFWNVGA